MNPSNPFSAPTADVADIMSMEAPQVPQVWSARGRIGRLRLFVYTGVSFLVFYLVAGIGAALFVGLVAALRGNGAGLGVAVIVGILGLVALCVASFVFSIFKLIQRSHDMGWSGWTVTLAFVPLVGLIWLFKAGTPGRNDYGPPPIPNSTGITIGAWIFGILMLLSFVVPLVGALAAGRH
jgi:uncharacterized membrane protein YhaH (DUF805 family)